MIIYSKTQKPDTLEAYFEKLQKAGKQSWIFSHCEFEYMIFYKQEKKKTPEIKEWKETPQWLEFIKLYREINKSGTYDKTLIRKYEIVLEKNKHEDIIKNLKQYQEHLKLYTSKPPLQVATYLNRNRFKDDWETIKIDYSEKWITDIMKEREIDEQHQERIMVEVRLWRKTYEPVREFTTNILESMIQKYWVRKEY